MGGRTEPDHTNDEKEIAGIRAAVEYGVTHIDTAEIYGGGHCEELVRQGIEGYDRSKLIITTKVLPGMDGGYDGVLRACEASLTRLGMDYLDLYLLHRFPHPGTPIKEVMRAMDRLVDEGMVKDIGVCNLSVNRFNEVQKHTANKVVCNQVHYSLEMRESEARGVVEYCQQNDVLLTAWGPLEKGTLAQNELLQELAEKYNKTQYQIALNWVMAQPNVVTIPKTTSVEHLEENLGALGWEMDSEDLDRLSNDFPDQKTRSERVALDYEADVAA